MWKISLRYKRNEKRYRGRRSVSIMAILYYGWSSVESKNNSELRVTYLLLGRFYNILIILQ